MWVCTSVCLHLLACEIAALQPNSQERKTIPSCFRGSELRAVASSDFIYLFIYPFCASQSTPTTWSRKNDRKEGIVNKKWMCTAKNDSSCINTLNLLCGWPHHWTRCLLHTHLSIFRGGIISAALCMCVCNTQEQLFGACCSPTCRTQSPYGMMGLVNEFPFQFQGSVISEARSALLTKASHPITSEYPSATFFTPSHLLETYNSVYFPSTYTIFKNLYVSQRRVAMET